jgi:hypothetical protein
MDQSPHPDQSDSCVDSTFLVTATHPQVSTIGRNRPTLLTAYPVPKLSVLDSSWYQFREPNVSRAPFEPSGLFLWELLVELLVFFHFHTYVWNPVFVHLTHVNQLSIFFTKAFDRAGIKSSVPEQTWANFVKSASELLQSRFSPDALKVAVNLELLRTTYAHMKDRRYHIATSFLHDSPTTSSSRHLAYSYLFGVDTKSPNLPGKLPAKFGKTGLVWRSGPLLLDQVILVKRFVQAKYRLRVYAILISS